MFVIDTENPGIEPQVREYSPGVTIKIFPISRDDFRQLQKRAARRQKGFRNRGAGVDEKLLDQLLYRKITGTDQPGLDPYWEGFSDKAGKPLPITAENVDLVMGQLLDLADWACDEAMALGEMQAEERAGELKNLKGSQGGTQPGRKG